MIILYKTVKQYADLYFLEVAWLFYVFSVLQEQFELHGRIFN